jgi:hypothetical protein
MIHLSASAWRGRKNHAQVRHGIHGRTSVYTGVLDTHDRSHDGEAERMKCLEAQA